MGDAVAQLVDEDAFVVPASWGKSIHPRRGGVPGPTLETTGDPEVIDRLKAYAQEAVHHPRSDAEIAGPARAYLTGADVTPLGAGVVAAAALITLFEGLGAYEFTSATRLADALVHEHGVPFAAAATVHAVGVAFRQGQYLVRRTDRYLSAPLEAMAQRVRAHLAAAPDEPYAQAVQALADLRGGPTVQRIVAAYLVPDQVAWVDELCAELAAAGTRVTEPQVLCALSTAEQLDRIADLVHPWVLALSGVAMTLAEGVGPAAATALMRWFDDVDADVRRRLLAVVAHLPSDEAVRALIDRMDQKFVAPVLGEMLGRYPQRAVRVLGEASGGSSAKARAAAELLRRHVLAYPDAVAAVALTLPPEVRARVESAVARTVRVREADPATLPRVLVAPPWTVKRAAPKPVVVAGLTPTIERGMAWAPGERQSWAATQPWRIPDSKWEKLVQRPVEKLGWGDRGPALAHGPESYVRPLLDTWRPRDVFDIKWWIRAIVARFESDATRLAMHAAQLDPAGLGSALLPIGHGDIAPLMADWLVRLKSGRSTALAWLARHPRVAGLALIPAALGKPGPERRAAEAALRAIAAAGHAEVIRDAAATYGEPAAAGIEALLGLDPLDVVPTRVPSLPDWAAPERHPQVLLRDRASALPAAAVTHLATMLAFSKPGEVYAGVDVVKEIIDRESLAEWGWSLFLAWQAAGLPAKEGWVLDAQGLIGTDETVRRLAPIIRAWPGEGGHARAAKALDVLAAIGSDIALMTLHSFAQKAKHRSLRERATEKIAEIAANRGLTPQELADRLVPDLGLEPDGTTVLDYGRRRFIVGFDEQLRPYVADEDGTRRKDLPKPGAADDPALADAAYKRFAALKKDVRTIAKDQVRRLEQAMVMQRRWSAAEFRELFVAHPLLWHVVRRLVWGVYDTDGTFVHGLRVAEDRTFADVHDDLIEVDAEASIGVAHPLHLGDTVSAWSSLLADYEIVQPFAQLARPTYQLSPEERDAARLARFEGLTVPSTRVLGLTSRGWVRSDAQDNGVLAWLTRALPGDRALVVNLEPGIPYGMVTAYPEQKLEAVWINDRPEGDWPPSGHVRFGELDPVTVSEILRDLTDLTR